MCLENSVYEFRMNFKFLDLNKLGLFKFQMSESSLFHSAITDRKKRILEEIVNIKLWDVVRISCSAIRIIFRNNIEKKRFFLILLKKYEACGTNVFAEVIPNLIPGKLFPKKYL